MLEHIKDAAGLAHRVGRIDDDAQAFATDVQSVCAAAAPQLTSESPEQAVAQLADLLTAARTIEARRKEIQGQRSAAHGRLEGAAHERRQAEAVLMAMCVEAGCQEPEQLPAAERNSQKRRELERDLREKESQLNDLAAGRALVDFLDTLGQSDASEVAAELRQLEEDVNALGEQQSVLDQTIGEQRTQLSQMDGNARAAEARQQAEQLLAKIRADAEQYAHLHLAAVLLERAIDRYRQQHQGPLLARASELFATLTQGRFDTLRADLDDAGSPVLVGVRSGDGEVVRVAGMSDGTCDQLYLALRLASLQADLAGREPLPFVVDDVLIKFDDDRAVAALKALAALSQSTQVIMFTHHEHIVRLAKAALDDDVLFTHQLDSRRGAAVAAAAAV